MNRHSIWRNSNAIEGLPLTMIVVMVVLAITVPLIIGSLRAYDRGRVEQEMASEIDRFVSMVQLIYTSGPGNSAVIEFSVPTGNTARIDCVKFGDVPGGNYSSLVRYTIQGRPETAVLLESPNVPMMSSSNESFQIPSGSHSIIAECLQNSNNSGGGYSSYTFIRLSLAT